MVSKDIVMRLSAVTEEERFILEKTAIDPNLYMEHGSDVINSKKLLEQGKLITIRPHPRFVEFPPHRHDYVEMVYMCSGETTHMVDGNEVTLREGELLLLNTRAVQSIRKAGAEDIAVNFIILLPFFDKALQFMGEEDTPLRSFILGCFGEKDAPSGYLHFKVGDVLPIQNLVENLLYTLIDDIPNKRNVNQMTMGLLFLQLINHADRIQTSTKGEALLLQVLRYVEEHYSTGSLSELARLLHYDLYWLSREIKTMTGKTYTELLQEKRLSQAAYLLFTTNLNVAHIARSVGYENVSYFHRLFSERFGMSPRQYRLCK
ncbi:MAG: helix-turn-helix domain-containing protein [Clostridia bacterium]|nr:helix-turn-helix domain-containing protein [Clostridia bacterium]